MTSKFLSSYLMSELNFIEEELLFDSNRAQAYQLHLLGVIWICRYYKNLIPLIDEKKIRFKLYKLLKICKKGSSCYYALETALVNMVPSSDYTHQLFYSINDDYYPVTDFLLICISLAYDAIEITSEEYIKFMVNMALNEDLRLPESIIIFTHIRDYRDTKDKIITLLTAMKILSKQIVNYFNNIESIQSELFQSYYNKIESHLLKSLLMYSIQRSRQFTLFNMDIYVPSPTCSEIGDYLFTTTRFNYIETTLRTEKLSDNLYD